jgi:hypothetical protein
MKLRKILVMSVIFAVTIGLVGVGTVHAQPPDLGLDGKWFRAQATIVQKELVESGRIINDPSRGVLYFFFQELIASDCGGFNYLAFIVTDIDDDGDFEVISEDDFSTCGNGGKEQGGVGAFHIEHPDFPGEHDVIDILFNGKIIKGKKIVSQGCAVIIYPPAEDDLTGQGLPKIISRNCKILLKLIDCSELPFVPPTVDPDLPPCL